MSTTRHTPLKLAGARGTAARRKKGKGPLVRSAPAGAMNMPFPEGSVHSLLTCGDKEKAIDEEKRA